MTRHHSRYYQALRRCLHTPYRTVFRSAGKDKSGIILKEPPIRLSLTSDFFSPNPQKHEAAAPPAASAPAATKNSKLPFEPLPLWPLPWGAKEELRERRSRTRIAGAVRALEQCRRPGIIFGLILILTLELDVRVFFSIFDEGGEVNQQEKR